MMKTKKSASGDDKNIPPTTTGDNDWPETKVNFYSRWTYSYLNKLLSNGAKKTLTMEDLWDIPSDLLSPVLLEKFRLVSVHLTI